MGGELKITSTFAHEGRIPAEYTADGVDISPPLEIKNAVDKTESIAIIADDPDAPGGTFTHWLIWDIPGDARKIPEGVPGKRTVAYLDGACQGKNDFGSLGYKGPAPPGGTHTYRFKVYTLDKKLDLMPGTEKETLWQEMNGNILQKGLLVGKYSRE